MLAQFEFDAHNLSGCNNCTTEFEYIHMIRNYDQSSLWGHRFYLTYSPWLFIRWFRQKSRQSSKNGNHVVYTLLIGRMLMPVIHMLFEIVEVLPVRENERWIMRLLIVYEYYDWNFDIVVTNWHISSIRNYMLCIKRVLFQKLKMN